MSDLGTLPGSGDSIAYAINANGTVVGESGNAFLYKNGVMTDLGTLPTGGTTRAHGINDVEQVVGTAFVAGVVGVDPDPVHGGRRAFVVENSMMSNLNDLIPPGSGWLLQEARDINNAGQIVGWGLVNGQQRAFLLTPIPVPAAAWLLASGVAAICVAGRRKRHAAAWSRSRLSESSA